MTADGHEDHGHHEPDEDEGWFDDDDDDAPVQTRCQVCGDFPRTGLNRVDIAGTDFAPGRAISGTWWLCSVCLDEARAGGVGGLIGRARMDGVDEESTELIIETLVGSLVVPHNAADDD